MIGAVRSLANDGTFAFGSRLAAREAARGLVACVALADCQSIGTDHLKGSARTCLKENARFPDARACIRARCTSGQVSGADPRLPQYRSFKALFTLFW